MPQRIGPPNTARVAITGDFNGCEWTNVLWFSIPDSEDATDAQLNSWLEDIVTAVHDTLYPNFSTSFAAHSAEATIFRSGGTVQRASWAGSLGGSYSTGTDLTGQAAMCVSWQTAAYYKGGHPRTYFSGLRSGMLTDGKTFSGTVVAAVLADALDCINALNAVTETNITETVFVLMRFFDGGVLQTPGVPVTITGAKVNARVDTQRRRLGR